MEEIVYMLHHLVAHGYVLRTQQDHFVFTNKFYKEITGNDIGAIPAREIIMVKTADAVITVPSAQTAAITLKTTMKTEDVKRAYLEFIKTCNIQRKGETSTHEAYSLNQYSDKGAKSFAKILKRVSTGELDLNLVIKSTELYYKSPGMKLKVGNYIGEGTWETHYNELLESIKNKSLVHHIKDSLTHDTKGTSRYHVGESNRESSSEDPRRQIGKQPGITLSITEHK